MCFLSLLNTSKYLQNKYHTWSVIVCRADMNVACDVSPAMPIFLQLPCPGVRGSECSPRGTLCTRPSTAWPPQGLSSAWSGSVPFLTWAGRFRHPRPCLLNPQAEAFKVVLEILMPTEKKKKKKEKKRHPIPADSFENINLDSFENISLVFLGSS